MDAGKQEYGCLMMLRWTATPRVSALALIAALGGCQIVPSSGPLTSEIVDAGGRSATERRDAGASVFEVIDVNATTARIVSQYQPSPFNKTFGFGDSGNLAVIGVGDELLVTIFEAGVDGLFSTQQNKQTAVRVVVQPDGRAAIPYVGNLKFAGRTLEQVRQTILAALKGKAVEPDVVVTTVSTQSRAVTVSGAVGASGLIPLNLNGDQVTEVIAKAGGPTAPPYETYVTLTRGNRTQTVLLKSIIEHPSEDIHVRPGDDIFVTQDPRTFTILGETAQNSRIPFGSNDLSLIEAVALAGGGRDDRADAKGYFIFRHEEPEVVRRLLGPQRFDQMVRKGMQPDQYGRYPLVYRIIMDGPDSLFAGQNFAVKNRDVIYLSRHPFVDFQKFLSILTGPLNVTSSAATVARL